MGDFGNFQIPLFIIFILMLFLLFWFVSYLCFFLFIVFFCCINPYAPYLEVLPVLILFYVTLYHFMSFYPCFFFCSVLRHLSCETWHTPAFGVVNLLEAIWTLFSWHALLFASCYFLTDPFCSDSMRGVFNFFYMTALSCYSYFFFSWPNLASSIL